MKSIYHILDKPPGIYEDQVQIEYEQLAQELVRSGRMRIDTDHMCNFVKYYDPQNKINIFLSLEELNNPKLAKITHDSIKQLYDLKRRHVSKEQINKIISSLKIKSKNLLPVTDEIKIQLARIFVQSAHPIVIRWLLLDRVQVFITYSHSIGDVMNVVEWQKAGSNSGMQSTDGVNACIYVSCGGDPFGKNYEENPTIGDGWAAVARLQIIAGQEIGHFADIKRDHNGNQITRHAADFACTKPVEHVRLARINDIKNCDKLLKKLYDAKINRLIEAERSLRFYDNQKVKNLRKFFVFLQIKYYRYFLIKYAETSKMPFIKRFMRDRYMGTMIVACIEDTKTHLSPIADVYKRADKNAEEAIACVEALARVPQQVNKWGHLTTRATMHNLYEVYYKEVIPSLIESYEAYTGQKYRRKMRVPKQNKFKKILRFFGVLDRNRFKFTEVRIPN